MNKNFHFVVGRSVTDKDKKSAPVNSVFRSAAAYQEGETLRQCASVSGAAPQAYRDAFDYIGAKPKAKPKQADSPAQGALING
jgi:hypothetical protein